MPLIVVAAIAGVTFLKVQAAREKGKQQEALAKYNAKVKLQEAEARKRAGKFAGDQKRDETRRRLRSIENQFATGGVIGSVGSPLKVELETAARGAQDARMIAYNTEIGVGRAESEASLFTAQAKSAKRASKINQGAALFSGVAQIGQFQLDQA